MDVSNQTDLTKIDLLYSFNKGVSFDKATPEKKVPMTFKHELTNIIVNIKAGSGITDEDLQDIGITFTGLNTKADFDLFESELSNKSDEAEIIPVSIVAVEGYTASFEAIIIPTDDIPDNAQIVFNLNNGDTETGTGSDIFVWEFDREFDKSTRYTYNATINRSGIVIEAIIEDWIDGGEQDIDAE